MTDPSPSLDALIRTAADRERYRSLGASLAAAQEFAATRAAELADLEARLAVEEADVRRIEGMSPTRLWATLRGDADERAATERAERDAAARAVAGAQERKRSADAEALRIGAERAALGDVEEAFAAALAAHEAELRAAGDAGELTEIAASTGAASDEKREIAEAVAASVAARQALAVAVRALDSAGGWSTYDTFFGGGFVADLMKHQRLDEATAAFAGVNRALERLRVELADIGGGAVRGVEISQELAVFDVLFDNILSDWMVRDRITAAQAEASDLDVRLTRLESDLAARSAAVDARLDDLARRREGVLLGRG
ncbi:hypothetical protein [Microbacterium sp. bgisy203]|uniref:hypothetical protein n=1 Tax=Microbacterium sp. bgisy203 TaxID=3413799 RepID=UPI003D736B12